MSKEMTAEEYLEGQYGTTDVTGPVLITTVIAARHYGDLRAKEAVKEFAEELMEFNTRYILTTNDVKALAKQKGVEI